MTIMTMAMCLGATGQTETTTAEEKTDSSINVIAYFCKNDTMEYALENATQLVVGGDTTLLEYTRETFMVTVLDSTNEGYRMEYVPTGNREYDGVQTDVLGKKLIEELGRLSDQLHIYFTTNEYGAIQHIENWREVSEFMGKAISMMCDSMYQKYPALDSVMPKKQMEEQFAKAYTSEESILEVMDELELLFGIHGSSFSIGETMVCDTTDFTSTTTAVAGYGSYKEDEGYDDDYYVIGSTVSDVPGEQATVTRREGYYLFYNGWPSTMVEEVTIDQSGEKKIETKAVTWTYRHWKSPS